MREKIAKILIGDDKMIWNETWLQALNTSDQIHKEYMGWFKEQIGKLQPLSDEELRQVIWEMGVEAENQGLEINQAMRFNAILLAQLAKDKDLLRGMK